MRSGSAHELNMVMIMSMVIGRGLQSVTDQTGNQPAQGNVLLLGGLQQVIQQII